MNFAEVFVTIFIYGFYLLFAFALIGWVDKKPPKKKTLKNLIKTYWSEAVLILGMIIGSHFMIKGIMAT